jgi:kinesin family protein 2/24
LTWGELQPLPLRAAADIFTHLAEPRHNSMQLWISCFEIYSGKLYDLLNSRKRLEAREDGKKTVQIVGLKELLTEDVRIQLNRLHKRVSVDKNKQCMLR